MNLIQIFKSISKSVVILTLTFASNQSFSQSFSKSCARIVHGNDIPVLSSESKVANLAYGKSYDECCNVAKPVAVAAPVVKLDTDGDGVFDDDDKCAGTPSGVKTDAMGCPLDSDADGIADYIDACPTIAGVELHKGCKDTDGDGLADPNDRCPDLAGASDMKGCPDSDKDGIVDIDDKCPAVAGLVENKGCPKVDDKTLKVLSTALTGLKFETGSAVIKKSSFPVLDKVVEVMNSHHEYKLDIFGHTDASGDANKNLELSKARAKAAKDYLISKGISESDITSEGFGSEQPIADNTTPAGKAKNRRVEFKVGF
ncbi:MAG: OmpA family protein [Cytophagales bacterium]|nr:MAG: OmpA family protein [Cytophagales bacterium]